MKNVLVVSLRAFIAFNILFAIPTSLYSQYLELVYDINPGPNGSDQSMFLYTDNETAVIGDDWLYFMANDGVNGDEIWRTNGTTTSMVTDISPGPESASIGHLTAVGNDLYFWSSNVEGNNLWRYDGSLLSNIVLAGGNEIVHEILLANSSLFIYAEVVGENENVLFKYDGVNAEEIFSGSIDNLCIHNDEVYFTHIDVDVEEPGLYKFNGTECILVQSIEVGNDWGEYCIWNNAPISAGSNLYFNLNDGINGCEIWKYDGISLTMITDFQGVSASSVVTLMAVGENLIFQGFTNESGMELHYYNAAEDTTYLQDINPGPSYGYGGGFTLWNNEYYFLAQPTDDSAELWKWNANGSEPILIDSQPVIAQPEFAFGNKLILIGYIDEVIGGELYAYDGNDISLLHDIVDEGNLEGYEQFVKFQNRLYFFADDETHGQELWRSTIECVTNVINAYDDLESLPNIYPNPTGHYFQIDFRKSTNINSVKVYNLLGEMISYSGNDVAERVTIDLHNHAQGSYFVIVEANENLYRYKVIKE
jgi:ELWxxDGT repeat protein